MRATETMNDRLRLLEMAEQLAGLGHWRFDVRSRRVSWSAEMFRIHGLLPDHAAPSYEAMLGHYLADDAARLDKLVDRAVGHGEAYTFEGRILRADGETRHVTAKAQCQLDETQSCVAIFGVFQDVTDQIRSKRVTQTLLSQLPALAAYWNTDLKCVFANARYAEWFNLTTDTIVGMTMHALWGDALYDANRPFVQSVLKGEVCVFERSLTKPSGDFAHLLAQYVPDQDDDGRIHGFFLLLTDLTDLKLSQLRLEAANGDLVQARNEAEEAARAKSEFLSNMSHELRTPLTSIIGFGDMLVRDHALDPVAGRHLRRMRDASQALLSTINDILDFSKLEAGHVEIEHRPIDAEDVGRAALDLLQPQADAKGLYRRFEASRLPALVSGDEVRIRQILLNLLSNAIKFTAQGGVTVAADYDDVTGVLRFEVRDTGLGVPADRVSRLFKRFSQVDASTSRTFGGTGLGLAICRGLAEAMGGAIGVESTPGVGSTFWFEMPCPKLDNAMGSVSEEKEIDLTEVLTDLRVLIVDDNPANRELARIICEQFGVVVTEADGGAEAVLHAQNQAFDVILLDIRMPEVDGPTVAQIVRSNPGPNQGAPIIGFTADAAAEFPAIWRDLFDGRLAKPIIPADFLICLADRSPKLKRHHEAAA